MTPSRTILSGQVDFRRLKSGKHDSVFDPVAMPVRIVGWIMTNRADAATLDAALEIIAMGRADFSSVFELLVD